MDDLTLLPIEAVIAQFEKDIAFNQYCYLTRFVRSRAQQELYRRGFSALPSIVKHLKANPPAPEKDLPRAWRHLLSWILLDVDPQKKRLPLPHDSMANWIAWAEEVIATEAARAEAKALA